MFTQKKQVNFLIIILFIFLLIFFLNLNNYIGNKFLYFIFQFTSFVFFLFAIKKNNSAFEFFTYFFFLLSFWFKFNCILYFDYINVTEGDFYLRITNYDNATFIIIIVFIACVCASLLKNIIVNNLIKKTKFEIKSSFIIFYKHYRFFIFFLFSAFLIFVWGTNYYFQIYSKGLINSDILPVVKYFYAWLLTYGLAVFTSILIYIDFLIFKNNKIFILGIIEPFFTQINILSRSFLIFFAAYLRGFLLFIDKQKILFSKIFVIKLILIILVFTFLSFYSVSKIRSFKFDKIHNNPVPITIASTFSNFFSLSFNRWVGIDALLAVSQNNKLSYEFFFSAWKEKKNIQNKSFYIDIFFGRFKYSGLESENLNTVITPGIVAFLYYSGSAIFVFFTIAILIIIFSLIEKLFYIISLQNIILANIIGYTLAVRFIHFGYVPANTLNFFLSFGFTLFIIFVLINFIKKSR